MRFETLPPSIPCQPPVSHPQLPPTATNRGTRVTLNKTIVRGEKRWVVSWFVNGRRHRRLFASKVAAEGEAATRGQEFGDDADVWRELPPGERAEIMEVAADARAHGVSLRRVWTDWLRGGGRAQKAGVKLGEAIDQLIAAKQQAGRSDRYTSTLDCILRGFAKGREAMPLTAVTAEEIDVWLNSKRLVSRPTFRARLATLFGFGIRRGWAIENPCARIEPVRLVRQKPAIFTVRQMARALVWSRRRSPRFLGWLVLSGLCGLRPEEAEKTSWAEISLEGKQPHIVVEAQTTKVRQRRVVYPMPMAVAWLRVAKKIGADLPLDHQARRRACRGLGRYLGWTGWPKDVTRHTTASYWLAQVENAAAVAEAARAQRWRAEGLLPRARDASGREEVLGTDSEEVAGQSGQVCC